MKERITITLGDLGDITATKVGPHSTQRRTLFYRISCITCTVCYKNSE